MVTRTLGLLVLLLAAALAAAGDAEVAQSRRVDLARWVDGWPDHFAVSGTKTEPTYREVVEVRRDGDVFTVMGGAPAWMALSVEAIAVGGDGEMRHLVCPPGMDCSGPARPAGFLASAAVLAARRAGRLDGTGDVLAFGGRRVVCVPAEAIGILQPILDPCLDLASGAVIAQRHRLSGRFDGPSLDAASVIVALEPTSTEFLPNPAVLPAESAP